MILRPTDASNAEPIPLDDDEKARLLRLARGTLGYYFGHNRRPTAETLDIACSPAMRAPSGAFVTLHRDGRLRGCIGELDPDQPLCDVVIDHALNAGLKDPRFPPVTPEEMERIRIEISALSPPQPVSSWHDIEIGVHGVVLSLRRARSVFLPQVAVEQGWDVETMLGFLAEKAGLPRLAWQDPDARLFVFEATVFGEDCDA